MANGKKTADEEAASKAAAEEEAVVETAAEKAAVKAADEEEAAQKKFVYNLTAKRLSIKGDADNLLVLAPLEKRRILSKGELDHFNHEGMVQRNLIEVRDEISIDKFGWLGPAATGALTLYIVGGAWMPKDHPDLYFWYWIVAAGVILLGFLVGILMSWTGNVAFVRAAAQSSSLLLILLVGVGVPAYVIYRFGKGRELLGGESSYAMVSLLQFTFIVAASVLPALLYFLFDRQRLDTLRERFERQIFRLDPNVKTLIDVRAKYGRQMEEVYGPEVGTSGRLIRGTRWPILVATLLITLGWLLTLPPPDVLGTNSGSSELLSLFVPRRTAVTFGFLGSYFFALNMVLRRYARGDLKPKAYSTITVRVLVVFILAWVIGLLFAEGNRFELGFMFLVGIVPETGLTFIQESLRSQGKLGDLIPSLQEKHPLTNLEGIDLYDRSRLLDEGVTNIESLAHHDLIDLMLETRIPVPRLVDWLDQAILYLHLMVNNEDHADEALAMRRRLRQYGIRTVTDLESAYQAAQKRDNKEDKHLLAMLSGADEKPNTQGNAEKNPDPQCKMSLYRIQVIMDTLEDDEWVDHVRHWREHNAIEELSIVARPGEVLSTEADGENELLTMR